MGVEATASLRREASFYSKELAPLVGIAVPQFYGLFTGGTMAAPIACLLMELCASTATLRCADEFARQAMLTVCKVHASGIMHNTSLDFRHFVMKEKRVFLVDFSCATVHVCGNAHPVLYQDNRSPIVDDEHDSSECQELMNAEQNIFSQIGERLL
ncbi:hypothetical protein BGW80DRAFT_1267371 [Lactifluus volemus]|nr:hypothetical protein BGW80DRAFT_1267371 [Lactifluus volemus]